MARAMEPPGGPGLDREGSAQGGPGRMPCVQLHGTHTPPLTTEELDRWPQADPVGGAHTLVSTAQGQKLVA